MKYIYSSFMFHSSVSLLVVCPTSVSEEIVYGDEGSAILDLPIDEPTSAASVIAPSVAVLLAALLAIFA